MIDRHGRTIDYVRISLTDRCNLRCVYCMPEDGVEYVPHGKILTFEEILRICRSLAGLGIKKVKLTGGEPLVRKGCAGLLAEIKKIPGIEEVTLTTNGILLKEQMRELKDAGLDAINISLDTLNPKTFAEITRRDRLSEVLDGIREALRYPQIPVKINSVPVSTDPEEFVSLASLAKNAPVHVRFIEMMPIGYGKQFPFRDEHEIKAILEKAYGPMTACEESYGNGPCHYYSVEGFQGRIGFISAITHKFCDTCNRVRLTSEGYLKACLQFQVGTDLRELMRNGCEDREIEQAIREVIDRKPLCHNFLEEKTGEDENRSMSQIGG